SSMAARGRSCRCARRPWRAGNTPGSTTCCRRSSVIVPRERSPPRASASPGPWSMDASSRPTFRGRSTRRLCSSRFPRRACGLHCKIEVELLHFLRKDHLHVSYERVVSGPGLRDTYRFVRATSGLTEPAWLTERMATGDPSAAIAAAGLGSEDVNAMRALEIL